MTFNPSAPAGLLQAQVLAVQPPDKLLVIIPAWGVGTRVPVRLPTNGQDDALRTNRVPMPGQGTWGGVMFMNQDSRNGFWMFSFPPGLANAYPNLPGDPNVTYRSEPSGHWEYRDGEGNETKTYADGTTVVVSQTGAPAVPVRNVVEGQTQVTQAVTQAQRVTAVKSPMTIALTTAGGFKYAISGDTMTMTGNLVVDGGITATQDIVAGEGGRNISLLNHTHAQGSDSAGDAEQNTTAPITGS